MNHIIKLIEIIMNNKTIDPQEKSDISFIDLMIAIENGSEELLLNDTALGSENEYSPIENVLS